METDNTRLAREHLEKLTNKKIIITTLQQMGKIVGILGIDEYLGATKESDDHITIALNPNKPETNEATFVHELLHIMLDYEGFPNIFINESYATTNIPPPLWSQLPKLQSYFSSVLDHPEIYRRMREDYDLDMERYFNALLAQKINRFNRKKWKNEQELTFSNQQDILDGLEYFYYNDNQSGQILSCFRENSESSYNSCFRLHEKIEKIGTHTHYSCLKSAKAIKSHIIKYGEKRNLNLLNNMWKALDIVGNEKGR